MPHHVESSPQVGFTCGLWCVYAALLQNVFDGIFKLPFQDTSGTKLYFDIEVHTRAVVSGFAVESM